MTEASLSGWSGQVHVPRPVPDLVRALWHVAHWYCRIFRVSYSLVRPMWMSKSAVKKRPIMVQITTEGVQRMRLTKRVRACVRQPVERAVRIKILVRSSALDIGNWPFYGFLRQAQSGQKAVHFLDFFVATPVTANLVKVLAP
jgi:hypothetical protein